MVCVLLGGKIPYILRKELAFDIKWIYSSVGDAYLHDFMDGEALDRLAQSELELELELIVLTGLALQSSYDCPANDHARKIES